VIEMPKKIKAGPKERTTVGLPDEMHRRAKAAASLAGISLQDYVTEAVEAKMKAPIRKQA